MTGTTLDVIPAKAGTQLAAAQVDGWVPAFAGMTAGGWVKGPSLAAMPMLPIVK
jgi:hypothetical protein